MTLQYEVKYQVYAQNKDGNRKIYAYDLDNLEGAQLKYYECVGIGTNVLVELQQVTVLATTVERFEDIG